MKLRATPSVTKFFYLSALVFCAHLARADGGVPMYRRPPQTAIANDALSHLAAAQHALTQAYSGMGKNDPDATYYIIRYGGYWERAGVDVSQTWQDIAAATAYIKAHPEANALPVHPLPSEALKIPQLFAVMDGVMPGGPIPSVDNVNIALSALVIDLTNGARAPLLGDLGGLNAKIINDFAKINADFTTAFQYDMSRHGIHGVIPLSVVANFPPDAELGPTTLTYLAQTRSPLTALVSEINNTSTGRYALGSAYAGDRTQGGYVAKVSADLDKVLAEMASATAYVQSHPDLLPMLANRPAQETSPVKVVEVPSYAIRYGPKSAAQAPKLNAETLSAVNNAVESLLNDSPTNPQGPYFNDLGGFRVKILDDLAQAQADILAGIDVAADRAVAANSSATSAPAQDQPDYVPVDASSATTAQAHLSAAQAEIRTATFDLGKMINPNLNPRLAPGPNGGYVEKALADLVQASVDSANATAYITAHPEVDALSTGPAAADALKMPPMPAVIMRNPSLNDHLALGVISLTAALRNLVNNPAPDYHGPVLGDLGGNRAKIIADLARAGADLSAAAEYSYYYSNGILPATLKSAMADNSSAHSVSIFASIAMSLGLSLGGLRFFARKKSR
jgi:hypothetical protein